MTINRIKRKHVGAVIMLSVVLSSGAVFFGGNITVIIGDNNNNVVAERQTMANSYVILRTNSGYLNIRSEAGNSQVVGRLPVGTIVNVFEYNHSGEWARVRWSSGYGWVFMNYLRRIA